MSTRDSPGCKGGRCVRLTTYQPCSAERQEIRGLNLPGPPWAISTACCGRDLYLYHNNIYYIIILDMFRAIPCSPRSQLSTDALNSCLRRVTIPDAVTIQFDLLKMSMVLLETCRGFLLIVQLDAQILFSVFIYL